MAQRSPGRGRHKKGAPTGANRSRDTEAALIEQATQLFRQRGYNGTSITDLAEALGLRNASVYYYVASKQELLLRVLQAAMDGFLGRLVEIEGLDVPSREKVRLAVENHLSFILERPDAVAVFLRERRFLEPPYTEQYDDTINRYDDLFVRLLQDAIDAGEISGIDAHITARLVLGAINWIVEWYHPTGPLSAEELSEAVVDFVMNRVLAPPA